MSQYDEHEEIVTTHGEIRGLRKLKDELDGFTPTADNINRLPQKIRDYIHALETRCDPAGQVAELVLTKDQNRQLVAEYSRMMAANGQFRSDVCYAAFGHRDALTDEQIIDSLKALREQCGLMAEILRLARGYRCQHCLGNPMTTDHDPLCKALERLKNRYPA